MPRKNKPTQLEKDISERAEEIYEGIAVTVLDDILPAFMDNIIVIARQTYSSGVFDVEELRGILEITYRETFIIDGLDSTLH